MCNVCSRIEEDFFSKPKEGMLRIWWIPQVPMKAFNYPVKSVNEAKKILNLLADYDLFQLAHRIKPDYSNVGGLQVFEDGEWIDWSDEEGNSIDMLDD